MEERNIGTMRKSPKQGLTNTEDLTLELPKPNLTHSLINGPRGRIIAGPTGIEGCKKAERVQDYATTCTLLMLSSRLISSEHYIQERTWFLNNN